MSEKGFKAVALTIDDGPRESTEKILDILESNGAHATFFVIGNQINKDNSYLLKRMLKIGCEIGNHGMYHNSQDENIANEFLEGQKTIEKYTAITPKLFRTAGLRQSGKIFKTVPIAIIGGYLDCPDWEDSVSVEDRIKGIKNNTIDGRILLTHDTFKNVKAFEIAIPEIIAKGYKILTVSEMIELGKIKYETGKIIF